jgi:hypothetical protein
MREVRSDLELAAVTTGCSHDAYVLKAGASVNQHDTDAICSGLHHLCYAANLPGTQRMQPASPAVLDAVLLLARFDFILFDLN